MSTTIVSTESCGEPTHVDVHKGRIGFTGISRLRERTHAGTEREIWPRDTSVFSKNRTQRNKNRSHITRPHIDFFFVSIYHY